MAVFVADASVALAWCFEDEATSWSDMLLDRLRSGDSIAVPAHWASEVLNALLVAARRNRIQPADPVLLFDRLSRLPIESDLPLASPQATSALELAQKHRLTIYDAAYLELAHRRILPIATLDSDLRTAAELERVDLL